MPRGIGSQINAIPKIGQAVGGGGVYRGTAFGAIAADAPVIVRADGKVEHCPHTRVSTVISQHRNPFAYAPEINRLISVNTAGSGTFYIRADEIDPKNKQLGTNTTINQLVSDGSRTSYTILGMTCAWDATYERLVIVICWGNGGTYITDVYLYSFNAGVTTATQELVDRGVYGAGYYMEYWSRPGFRSDTGQFAWCCMDTSGNRQTILELTVTSGSTISRNVAVNNYGGTSVTSYGARDTIVWCSGISSWALLWHGTVSGSQGTRVSFASNPSATFGNSLLLSSGSATVYWEADYDPTSETIAAIDMVNGASRAGHLIDVRSAASAARLGSLLNEFVQGYNAGVIRMGAGKFLTCCQDNRTTTRDLITVTSDITAGSSVYAKATYSASYELFDGGTANPVWIFALGNDDYMIIGQHRDIWWNEAYAEGVVQNACIGFATDAATDGGTVTFTGPGGIHTFASGGFAVGTLYTIGAFNALAPWSSSENYYYTDSGAPPQLGLAVATDKLALGVRRQEHADLVQGQ